MSPSPIHSKTSLHGYTSISLVSLCKFLAIRKIVFLICENASEMNLMGTQQNQSRTLLKE